MVLGLCYYFARQFDETLRRHHATLEMDPDNIRVHAQVARAHGALGRHAEGLRELVAAIRRVGRAPQLLEQLGTSLIALGRPEEARGVIEELDRLAERQYVSPMHRATIHLALGDEEEFFRRLDEAVEQRSGHLPFLAVEPLRDRVHGRPRFQALLRWLRLTGR